MINIMSQLSLEGILKKNGIKKLTPHFEITEKTVRHIINAPPVFVENPKTPFVFEKELKIKIDYLEKEWSKIIGYTISISDYSNERNITLFGEMV